MNLSWREAIQKVLAQSAEPMHYVDIADAITAQNSRDVGANPAGLVNSTLAGLIGKESNDFVRIGRGYYWLRSSVEAQSAPPTATVQQDSGDVKEAGLINALGMYWSRENVNWMTTPRILGRQQIESRSVDFCGQRGVYLLHDGRAVVYVGRALERALGVRLENTPPIV